jgi:hypothetical protein
MKKLGYFLAGNIMLALTLAVGTAQAATVPVQLTGGCPCRQKPKPLPKEEEQKLYADVAKQAEANKKRFGGPKAANKPKLQQKSCYYSQSSVKFPVASHFISEVDPAGSMVSIQDGSGFTVKENQQYIAKTWELNSPIAVKPNSLSLWNKIQGSKPIHKYQLVNLKTNQSVEATLALGPFKNNPSARQILRLDGVTGEIYLNNGSCWKVDLKGTGAEFFKSWKKNHYVILGMNDTWFSLGNQFIMIDVDTDNWLPASRVY